MISLVVTLSHTNVTVAIGVENWSFGWSALSLGFQNENIVIFLLKFGSTNTIQ